MAAAPAVLAMDEPLLSAEERTTKSDDDMVGLEDGTRVVRGASEVAEEGSLGVWGAAVTLAVTCMGAGVLSLPATLADAGWGLGLAALVGTALLSDLSMVLMLRSADSSHSVDYPQLGLRLGGRFGGVAVRVGLAALLYGALVTLLIVAGDLMPQVLHGIAGERVMSRSWGMGTCLIAVLPLTLTRTLAALRHVSTASAAALAFVVFAVLHGFLAPPRSGKISTGVDTAVFGSATSLALPVDALAFCCQFNVLPVRNELRPAARPYAETAVHYAILGTALPAYALVGLLGYLSFGRDVPGDLLTAYGEDSHVAAIARACVALVNVLKLPLVSHPLRDLVLDALWPPHPSGRHPWGRLAVVTLAVNGLAIVGALALSDLQRAFDLIGSTAGMLVLFVLPGWLFLRSQPSEKGKCADEPCVAACVLIGFGVAAGVLGLFDTIVQWMQ